MSAVNDTKVKPTLVTGRVGELVDYANDQTFELVRAIFSHNGPYRKVLAKFGIGDLSNTKDYLKLIDGRVYSDIDVETEVLWKPCSYKLSLSSEKVLIKFHFYGLLPLLRFLKKAMIELITIAFIDHYLTKVDKLYREFSLEVENTFEAKALTNEKFLSLYEQIVYVAYLYELVFGFNNSKTVVAESTDLKKYVLENDYLLASQENYAEFCYKLPQNFVLGTPDNFTIDKPIHPKFIPSKIPDYNGKQSKIVKAEAKLQCIKNNMRLKTNILLYFLNQTLYLEA